MFDTTRLPLLSALVLAIAGSGCVIHTTGTVRSAYRVEASAYARPQYVTVQSPPPPLRAAVVPGAKPHPDAVWISGHWVLVAGGWQWQTGRWEIPRAGHVWEPPVCVAVHGGGYQYHPGYWHPRDAAPPAVYRTNGAIRVHVQPRDVYVHVDRVPPRRADSATVYVTPGSPRGQSDTVTVTPRERPTTTVTANGTATVTTQPRERPTVTVTAGGGTRPSGTQGGTTTVTTRPGTQRPGTVTARPGTTTTTTARPGSTARPGTTTTTTVRPGSTARPGTTTTTTVRPSVTARPGTTTTTTARPATNARPATTTTTTARPTVMARPGTSTTTTVRPAGPSVNGPGTQPGTVRPGTTTTVMAGTRPNVNARPASPQANVRVQCQPRLATVPSGGVLVLGGNGLDFVQQVQVGSATAAIIRKTNREIRVRVPNGSSGGRIVIRVGGSNRSCGSVQVR